jgi:hypothetical protein
MARKTSLYLDPAGDSILAARGAAAAAIKRHGRRSLILRELMRRYDEICRGDPPDLTDAEWSALVEAGETWHSETDIDAGVRWARLLDAANRNEPLGQKLLALPPFPGRKDPRWSVGARGEPKGESEGVVDPGDRHVSRLQSVSVHHSVTPFRDVSQ